MSKMPIACNLTQSELDTRINDILKKIAENVSQVRELENGFRYSFPADEGVIEDLANVISFERKCCPFLSFSLIANSDETDVWLELTGPEGTKESIAALLKLPTRST